MTLWYGNTIESDKAEDCRRRLDQKGASGGEPSVGTGSGRSKIPIAVRRPIRKEQRPPGADHKIPASTRATHGTSKPISFSVPLPDCPKDDSLQPAACSPPPPPPPSPSKSFELKMHDCPKDDSLRPAAASPPPPPPPSPPKWFGFCKQGCEAFTDGEFAQCIERFTSALDILGEELERGLCGPALQSEKAKLLVNRAAALVMVGKFQEALQDGIAAVELDRTFLRAHLRVAKCCLLLGKADDAKEAYQQMDLVLRGLNPRQYPRLDDYRAQLHEGLLAVESLESLLWEINRCTVANDNKGALRATKDAMAIAIGSQELRLQKVTLLLTLCEFDKVEAYCTYLVRKSASGGIISLGIKMAVLYCRALHYHDKTEQAFEVLEQLLRVAPTNVDLLHVKRLWELMEDVSLAAYEAFNRVLLYTKALTLDKHHRTYNASVLGSRATTYMALAQYDKAVQDCNAALKYRPVYFKVLLRRARCYDIMNLYKESVADYDEYMAKAKMTPDDLRHVRRERDQVQEDWDRSKYRRDGWDNDFPYSSHQRVPNEQHRNKAHEHAGGANQNGPLRPPYVPPSPTHYQVLRVPSTATQDEIKKSYRKLALVYHPDKAKTAQDGELFKYMSAAYGVLSDKQLKAAYDMELRYRGH
ncbi:hypothetical protein AaE_014272 [Aphanomyces astaci]|uniref:J domain-containing protein n=1 Tax=Aphanomyces astaci TaxID=112090 RepID=A0A6A4Z283_APHAT|nr:hypothetical protein AaE_014272 [Aphanomyces astaci]